ncbi:MAG TPA: O-acetyl-ADP-ribose deacetylase [Pyrinomonadaceae bacterium]|nr:O-acetyl-ADP-ribose deacetylase [Pyrinomonadaceae bacterium]
MYASEIRESFLNGRVTVLVGNIMDQRVDAIVNAANSTLLGGGGVDGAIHAAGGPQILDECKEIRCTRFPKGLPTGEAVITSGGKLLAPYVIHTVGPIKGRSGERDGELLAASYRNSLALAVAHSLSTIAFPSISTGAYGYPREEAATVSSEAIKGFLNYETSLKEVRLIFFMQRDARVFLKNQRFVVS